MRFKDKSNNCIIKIHLFRMISFLIFYGIFGIGNFLFFRSYVLLAALVVFMAVPIASCIFVHILSKNIKVSLFASDSYVQAGTILGIGLVVTNDCIFSSLALDCTLNISNEYYGENSIQKLSFPVVAKASNKNPIICESCSCGIIDVALSDYTLKDALGFMSIIKSSKEKIAITVVPTQTELDDIQKLGIVSGYADNEDDTKKGNEYSDTSNIREYIPGDRIKDIHWKLSSKRDIILVKEHIRTCENKLLIWIDYSPNKDINEKILKFVCAVAKYCISENIYLKFIWLSNDGKTMKDCSVLSQDDLMKAYNELFNSAAKTRKTNIKEIIYSNQIKANKFIRIGYSNSEVGIHVYEI